MKRIGLSALILLLCTGCQPKDPVNDPALIRERMKNHLKYNESSGFDYVYYIAYRLLEAKNIADLALGSVPEQAESPQDNGRPCAAYSPSHESDLSRSFYLHSFYCDLTKIQPLTVETALAHGDEIFDVNRPSADALPHRVTYKTINYHSEILDKLGGIKDASVSSFNENRSLEMLYLRPEARGHVYRFLYSISGPVTQLLKTENQTATENGRQVLRIEGYFLAVSGSVSRISVQLADFQYDGSRTSQNRTRRKDKQQETSHAFTQVILNAVQSSKKQYAPLVVTESGYLEGTLRVGSFATTKPKDKLTSKTGKTIEFSSAGITVTALLDDKQKPGESPNATRPWYHLADKESRDLPWMKAKSGRKNQRTSTNRFANWIPYSAIFLK